MCARVRARGCVLAVDAGLYDSVCIHTLRLRVFCGRAAGPDGRERAVWEGGEIVQAVAYDNPVPGFDTYNTINLRLFRAAPAREFDLASFNTGDYMRAVDQRQRAETITHVLYPSDNTYVGKELRLKQQYFFVCATIQDVIRRFKRMAGWVRMCYCFIV